MISAQMNPFLQFALGCSVWMLVLLTQLIVRRVASIWFGHECIDFVDVCSVANVSVLFMDEPFHGYYIHGKAPSGKGDWCHTELAKVLRDEDMGIALSRGLTVDGVQSFEMFLPPDMAVQVTSGMPAHFRQTLCKLYGDVNATTATIASRKPDGPTVLDIAQMSHHRCAVQRLMDCMVHAVMRGAAEVVQSREGMNWFWGALPSGGVATLQQPLFYKDYSSLAWLACLAYGHELRLGGLGLPAGFEWHVGLLEVLMFSVFWRFHGSIYAGCAAAFLLNQGILAFYSYFGRRRLAYTSVINDMFLLVGSSRCQNCIYVVVVLAFFIHELVS